MENNSTRITSGSRVYRYNFAFSPFSSFESICFAEFGRFPVNRMEIEHKLRNIRWRIRVVMSVFGGGISLKASLQRTFHIQIHSDKHSSCISCSLFFLSSFAFLQNLFVSNQLHKDNHSIFHLAISSNDNKHCAHGTQSYSYFAQ